MNKQTEYVITCKLTPDTDPYVLAYNEGNDGYFWTEKENIERLREQNIPPHRFIFENFHEAKTVRNIVNNCSFKCGIVPLSFLHEPSYTIIHRKNPTTRTTSFSSYRHTKVNIISKMKERMKRLMDKLTFFDTEKDLRELTGIVHNMHGTF